MKVAPAPSAAHQPHSTSYILSLIKQYDIIIKNDDSVAHLAYIPFVCIRSADFRLIDCCKWCPISYYSTPEQLRRILMLPETSLLHLRNLLDQANRNRKATHQK